MVEVSYINSYQVKIKLKQPETFKNEEQVLKPVLKNSQKRNLRRNWALTAVLTSLVMTGLTFIGKGAKSVPLRRKVGVGLLAGASFGSAIHFLFTKKSKLKEDNLTNNFGKRLGIMAGIGAINTVISLKSINPSKVVKQLLSPVRIKGKDVLKELFGKKAQRRVNALTKKIIRKYQSQIGLYTGIAMVSAGALLYTTAEAIKSMADDSLKNKKSEIKQK